MKTQYAAALIINDNGRLILLTYSTASPQSIPKAVYFNTKSYTPVITLGPDGL